LKEASDKRRFTLYAVIGENHVLEIKDLRASAGDTEILRGINLTVNPGEVHAVMGPNGSGKSTLAQVLAGHPSYEVTAGSATYEGQDLLDMEPEERAQAGLFLAFQYPVEIPGVSNAYFLRAAYNEIRKARGLEEIDSMDFIASRRSMRTAPSRGLSVSPSSATTRRRISRSSDATMSAAR
jgi:FeS assembly ATPase SufC